MPRDTETRSSNPPPPSFEPEPDLELDDGLPADEAPVEVAQPPVSPTDDLPPPEPQVEGPKRTPEQWAERLGHVSKARPHIPQSVTHYDWQHAAADKLHGWSRHAYNFQDSPLLITQEDYEKALDAAAEYPNVPAYEPALSTLLKENV